MPFVAELDGERIDLTVRDEGLWTAIHRQGLGDRLVCPECRGVVRAKKMSSTGTRFVAHAADPGGCSMAGESPDHLRLKLYVIGLLRDLGWEARPEVSGPGWRADVLAYHPDAPSRSLVFEVQLSTQTDNETDRRQQVLSGSGHQVLWITRRTTTWFRRAPSVSVRTWDWSDVTILDGVWIWDDRANQFAKMQPRPLDEVVCHMLDGTLVWVPDLWVTDDQQLARARRSGRRSELSGGGWVSKHDLDEAQAWSTEAKRRDLFEKAERERVRAAAAARFAAERTAAQSRPRSAWTGRRQPVIAREHDGAENVRHRQDIVRAQRRADAVSAVVARCEVEGWQVEERQGSLGSYWGTVLIVEGKLLVVEPEGVRNGVWPGAVVIGSPVMAERKNVTDLTVVSVSDWLARPLLGSSDPAAVEEFERRYRPSRTSSFTRTGHPNGQQRLDL